MPQAADHRLCQNHPVAVRYPRGAGPGAEAAERLDATVVNMRWAKPLDVALLLQVAAQHEAIVTVEEGAIMGGAGSAVPRP
jgi:deoxyxylulose-5-phosphate synthase